MMYQLISSDNLSKKQALEFMVTFYFAIIQLRTEKMNTRLFICHKNTLIGPHYAHSCMHMKIKQLQKHPWQFICFMDLSGRYVSNAARLQPFLAKRFPGFHNSAF